MDKKVTYVLYRTFGNHRKQRANKEEKRREKMKEGNKGKKSN